MWHKYPYTDFHELNLDWLLGEWRKFLDTYQTVFDRMDTVEAAFDALKKFVDDYFDNLDVSQEISDKLDDMLTNGDLQPLLQDVIDELTADAQQLIEDTADNIEKITENLVQLKFNDERFSCERLFRVLKKRYRYGADKTAHNNDTVCFASQGMTYYNGHIFIGYTNSTSTKSLLEERMPDGTLLQTSNYNLLHCNDLEVINGEIFVCTLSGTGAIEVMDPGDLSHIRTIIMPRDYRGIGHDIKTGKTYGVSGYNYYELDLDTATETLLFTATNVSNVPQSICAHDGFIYEVSAEPNIITIFKPDGEIVKNITVSDWMDFYYFGEIESIHVDDTDVYINSNYQWQYDNYRHNAVWHYNFEKGFRQQVESGYDLGVGSYQYCCVDASATSMNPKGNCSGNDRNDSFQTISEALIWISSPAARNEHATDIRVFYGTYDEHVYLRDFDNIRIMRYDNNQGKPIINSGLFVMCSDLTLENMIVNNDDDAFDYTARIYSSRYASSGAVFKTTKASQDYCIYASSSLLSMSGYVVQDESKYTESPISAYLTPIWYTTGNMSSIIDNGTIYHQP